MRDIIYCTLSADAILLVRLLLLVKGTTSSPSICRDDRLTGDEMGRHYADDIDRYKQVLYKTVAVVRGRRPSMER